MSLIFIRHGESTGNVVGQDERAGWDIPNHAYPLTDRGRQQARFAGQYLMERFGTNYFHSTTVTDSDFLRSQETLDEIVGIVPVFESNRFRDSRLNEKWDGIFHDLTKAELEEKYKDQINLRKRTGYYLYRAPGGESCPDVEERVRSFIRDYWDIAVNQRLLVSGHGRWFLVFQKVVHRWTVEEFLERKKKDECANCMVAYYSQEALLKRQPPECSVPWRGKLAEAETDFA